MATVADWIITIHDSERNQAEIYRKFGKETDIAKAMFKMIKKARKDHEDTWDEDASTNDIGEILEYGEFDFLYGVAAFCDHHIDFTAKRLDYIEELEV